MADSATKIRLIPEPIVVNLELDDPSLRTTATGIMHIFSSEIHKSMRLPIRDHVILLGCHLLLYSCAMVVCKFHLLVTLGFGIVVVVIYFATTDYAKSNVLNRWTKTHKMEYLGWMETGISPLTEHSILKGFNLTPYYLWYGACCMLFFAIGIEEVSIPMDVVRIFTILCLFGINAFLVNLVRMEKTFRKRFLPAWKATHITWEESMWDENV